MQARTDVKFKVGDKAVYPAQGVAEVISIEEKDIAGSRQMPPGLGFDGRPQMAARFAGAGGGQSLLFNGHIDVVPAEPRDRWTSENAPAMSATTSSTPSAPVSRRSR